MAEPTLTDIMAELHRIDLQNQQQTSLLNALAIGVQLMSKPVSDTKASVDDLAAKTDAFIAAVTPAIAAIQAKLDAALAQIASGDPSPADVVILQSTLTEAQDEAAKVVAATQALGTPTPPPAP
jgi:hypothetical protein